MREIRTILVTDIRSTSCWTSHCLISLNPNKTLRHFYDLAPNHAYHPTIPGIELSKIVAIFFGI